jgi:hypothetical protein
VHTGQTCVGTISVPLTSGGQAVDFAGQCVWCLARLVPYGNSHGGQVVFVGGHLVGTLGQTVSRTGVAVTPGVHCGQAV